MKKHARKQPQPLADHPGRALAGDGTIVSAHLPLPQTRPSTSFGAHRRFAFAATLTLVMACGSEPTGPQYPEVSGTYAGPVVFSSSLGGSLEGSMSIAVVQAGAQVTITGSITFLGDTTNLPAITGNINETGFFTASAGGFSDSAEFDPECGLMTPTSSTLAFSGNTAQIHESVQTGYCGTWTLSGTLTK